MMRASALCLLAGLCAPAIATRLRASGAAWCYQSTTSVPSKFGKIAGLADDQCQVWYFSQGDALMAVEYDMSKAAGSAQIPSESLLRTVGSGSYYAGHVFAAVSNQTHGAVATFMRLGTLDRRGCAVGPGAVGAPLSSTVLVSDAVSAPLAWAASDFAAGAVWSAPRGPLTALYRFAMLDGGQVVLNGTLPLSGFDATAAVAATVPQPGTMYVALEDGRVVAVDTRQGMPAGGSLETALIVDTRTHVQSLGNLWSIGLGTMHLLAANGTSIVHYDFC